MRRTSGLHSVLDAHTLFRGTLTSQGVMEIRGRVEGDIEHDGKLIIAAGACCISHIKAGQLEIAGEVRGNVEIQGRLEIRQGGQLNGDAACGSLTIRAGGALNGRNRMYQTRQKQVPSPEAPVPAKALITEPIASQSAVESAAFDHSQPAAALPVEASEAILEFGFKGRPRVRQSVET